MGQYNGGMGRFGWKRKCNEPFMYSLGCSPRMPVTKKVQVRIYNTQNVTCFPGSDWNRCGGTSRVDAEFCAWTTSGSFIQVMDFLSLVILCIVADCICFWIKVIFPWKRTLINLLKNKLHGRSLWIPKEFATSFDPCIHLSQEDIYMPTIYYHSIFFRIHLLKLQ